jgi:diaminohydroxyphosphoribosylaminopyrimidine deaminase/5-amino-6-(5-phosphoribosylamino)uracil reductase
MDVQYMKLALSLAKKGFGHVNPNPLVGAVIVKDGKVIGEGYHEKYGQLHAERNALADCKVSPEGVTLYVTLEPCCHYGKTPPCTEAIIENGIKRVVIGSLDPNPLVSGKGVLVLREHGIEVIENVLKEECDKINEVFFHYIRKKTPYVVMKYAMTMDGKIATVLGKSKWITGDLARENVHKDRNRYSAIMVGVGTVVLDNPHLTCQMENGRNPIRIVCDTNLKTPLDAYVIHTAKDIPTIIATSCEEKEKYEPYLQSGCEIITVSKKHGHTNLKELMEVLGERKIDSILLEGGATLNWSALQSGIVSKIQCYIAPKLFGGEEAKSPIAGLGVDSPEHAFLLKNSKVIQIGVDIMVESEVVEKSEVARKSEGVEESEGVEKCLRES